MPTAAAASSSITILELGVQRPRKLVLVGSGLPHRDASWSASQRVTTTWYAGNGVASQQVLGPRENPSTFEGTWKRTMLPAAPPRWTDDDGVEVQVVQPQVLRNAMDALRVSGSLLRVTWASEAADGSTSDSVVREGRLTEFEVTYETYNDVTWKATFEWVSRGQTRRLPVSSRDDSVSAAAAAYEVAQQKLQAASEASFRASRRNIAGSASYFTLGQLEALSRLPLSSVNLVTRRLQQVTSTFNRFLGIVNTLKRTPLDTMSNITSVARNAVTTANQYCDAMGRVPVELQSTKSNVVDMLRAHSYYADININVALSARAAMDIARRFIAMRARAGQMRSLGTQENASAARQDSVVAVHKVRAGETAISLSVRYYQSPDHGADILKANRLPWYQSTLTPGAVLVIPSLSVGAYRT